MHIGQSCWWQLQHALFDMLGRAALHIHDNPHSNVVHADKCNQPWLDFHLSASIESLQVTRLCCSSKLVILTLGSFHFIHWFSMMNEVWSNWIQKVLVILAFPHCYDMMLVSFVLFALKTSTSVVYDIISINTVQIGPLVPCMTERGGLPSTSTQFYLVAISGTRNKGIQASIWYTVCRA